MKRDIHADGTFTFTNTDMGLNEKLKIPNEPTLSRDAGTVTIADTFAATSPFNLSQRRSCPSMGRIPISTAASHSFAT